MRDNGKRGQVRLPSRAASQRVAILVLLVVGLALLMIGRTDPETFDLAKSKATAWFAPVLEIVSKPVGRLRDWRNELGDLMAVHEENQRLRGENARLKDAEDRARILQYQIDRYQALLNVHLDPGTEFVTGRVVGDSGSPFVRSLIVTAGENEGVKEGHGVIDEAGLIGHIVDVGPRVSRVLLLTDSTSRVPVLITPGNYKAIMIGDNSGRPTINFLPVGAKIKAGDRVFTSGHGGQLPPGLPIGELTADKKEGAILRVKLASQLEQVDSVRILKFSVQTDLPSIEAPASALPPASAPAKAVPVASAPAAAPGTAAAVDKKAKTGPASASAAATDKKTKTAPAEGTATATEKKPKPAATVAEKKPKTAPATASTAAAEKKPEVTPAPSPAEDAAASAEPAPTSPAPATADTSAPSAPAAAEADPAAGGVSPMAAEVSPQSVPQTEAEEAEDAAATDAPATTDATNGEAPAPQTGEPPIAGAFAAEPSIGRE